MKNDTESEVLEGILKSLDKHLACGKTMKLILSSLKYRGRRRNLGFIPDPEMVVYGSVELGRMKNEARQ